MKKLAHLAVVIVLVVLAVRLWPDRTDTVAPAPTTSPTSTTPTQTATDPSVNPAVSASADTGGPVGGTAEARRQWEPTVQGFALAFPDTEGLTRKQWLMNLSPFLDRPVLDALSITDLDKVPHGHYAGYQLLKAADEAITVRLSYQEGWALVLYLAATGDNWTVSALDTTSDFD
jgi:hypothetical protein